MKNKKYFRFIVEMVKTQKNKVIVLFSILFFAVLVDLIQPVIASYIIDNALKNFDYKLLLCYLFVLVLAYLIGVAISYIQKITSVKIQEQLKYDIRLNIFSSLLNRDIGFLKEKDVGELMSRMLVETSDMIKTLITSSINIIMCILHIVVVIIIMFDLNPLIASVNVIFGLVTFYLMIKSGKKINEGQGEVIRKYSQISNEVNESIYNIKTIKYLGIYDFILKKISTVLKEDYSLNVKFNKVVALINIFLGICIFLPNIFLWAYGGYLVGKNLMTVGILIALSNYFEKFISSINQLKTINVDFEKFKIIYERLEEIICTFNDNEFIKTEENDIIMNVENIELRDISAGYYTELFSNLNLLFLKGEVIKISGKNAIGKTTLINIITGLILPKLGTIYINKEKVEDIGEILKSKNIFGVIPQEVQLFSGTVRENICLDKTYSDEEIESLIVEIGLEGINNTFLNKKVINRGINLSGGQRQKLAILRTLIRKPQVLIMDEATSNLDAQSKKCLYDYIYRTKNNRINLIITHDDLECFTREVKIMDYVNK